MNHFIHPFFILIMQRYPFLNGQNNINFTKMKQLLIASFAFLLLIGCKKDNSTTVYDNKLPGTWKEFEYFLSPGAGGAWQQGNGLIVTINTDFSYNTNNENSFWGKTGKITILTDSTLSLKRSSVNSEILLPYKIQDGVFEIWYLCFEGCGSRFRK